MTGFATFHDLAGQSVFITGGGSGIGAALVEGFLQQGCKVAFCDIMESTELSADLAEKHGNAPLFLNVDVTDIPALQASMQDAAASNGPITILVNNAARDTRHSVEGYSVAEWDETLAINLRPHFFTAQQALPGMRSAGGGSIINFSSIAYMMGGAGFDSYVAAKAGITALTRGLARELGPDKIRVNAVMPGWVLTERQKALWATPEGLANMLDRQCLKEHLSEVDIVDGVLFLASGASRMMTGQALVIDGGVVVTG